MRRFAEIKSLAVVYLFILLLCFPFDWQFFSGHTDLIHWFFDRPTAALAHWWTGREPLIGLASDSQQSWALLGLLLPVSLLLYLGQKAISRCARCEKSLRPLREILSTTQLVQLAFTYYLAIVFLRYGLDKIAGSQFAQPDMYVLFAETGQLDRDLLYWTVMGSSRTYQWWLGLAEIIPALLLLWPRWRRLGAWLLLPVTLNVVAVNWSFDISVKLFSALLLLLNLAILGADFRRFIAWVDNRPAAAVLQQSQVLNLSRNKRQRIWKTALLSLLLLELIWPYAQRGFFWESQRPVADLHGVYTAPEGSDWYRLYILRDDYWILEDQARERYRWRRAELPFQYRAGQDGLRLQLGEEYLHFKSLPVDDLPLLQSRWHWSVD
ncbi:MAG: hypothetical protein AAF433_22175 [Bacteroidota bacterium]